MARFESSVGDSDTASNFYNGRPRLGADWHRMALTWINGWVSNMLVAEGAPFDGSV